MINELQLDKTKYFNSADIHEIFNIAMDLRQSQLNGTDHRSGDEVMSQWIRDKRLQSLSKADIRKSILTSLMQYITSEPNRSLSILDIIVDDDNIWIIMGNSNYAQLGQPIEHMEINTLNHKFKWECHEIISKDMVDEFCNVYRYKWVSGDLLD
jgi:hypothetical protein